MRFYLIIFPLLFSINLFSQDKSIKALNKVKSIYHKSIICTSGKNECSVYFNRDQKELDLDNYLIPLLNVKLEYSYNKLVPKRFHYVLFNCINENCIMLGDSKEMVDGVSIPFISKKDCYEFIDALSILKELIKY